MSKIYYFMPSPSKEEQVLKLFLENSPFKEWHFEEVIRESKVTKAVANKWLKKYVEQGLLHHVKKKGSFPYFVVGQDNPVYYSMKRIYVLEQLHKSGLIAELLSTSAKTIIFFGSMIRGDWYKDSDIDIFVFGGFPDFNKKAFETKLGREIELHAFQNKEEIAELKTGLIKNIVNGYVVKGQLQDFVEIA